LVQLTGPAVLKKSHNTLALYAGILRQLFQFPVILPSTRFDAEARAEREASATELPVADASRSARTPN